MKTPQKADFAGQDIHVGIDVHLRRWQVSVFSRHGEFKTFSQDADSDRLLRYLQREFPGANIHAVYEAGFSGFWLCRRLRERGINAVVVHPGDVSKTDKDRRYKRNKRDARLLARKLRAEEIEPIYVPSEQQESDRSLVRLRYQLVGKQTRVKNQIKSHLRVLGIELMPEHEGRVWSRRFLDWLGEINEQHPRLAGTAAGLTLESLLRELHYLRSLLLDNMRSIRTLSRVPRYRNDVDNLVRLSGIGPLSAMILLTEIADITRFRSLDSLACFAGLVPTLHGSGEDEREGGLTPRRSRQMRRILIESAWVAVRRNAELMASFDQLCVRMKPNQAIIRIARKQLARVHYVLKNKTACR
jgi:transposase